MTYEEFKKQCLIACEGVLLVDGNKPNPNIFNYNKWIVYDNDYAKCTFEVSEDGLHFDIRIEHPDQNCLAVNSFPIFLTRFYPDKPFEMLKLVFDTASKM